MAGVSSLLNLLPASLWNDVSYLSSLFTVPDIGSPIRFNGDFGFTMAEYGTLAMPEPLRREFLSFCYPQGGPERSVEIGYDRSYWPRASTFILRDRSGMIAGCAQFIEKSGSEPLPAENGLITGAGGSFSVTRDVGECRSAEIYRLRRAFDIDPARIPLMVTMLFKAIWAKIVQTRTAFAYITCDGRSRELRNLYLRRLFFEDPGVRVTFGREKKEWVLLRKDCLLHEERFAALSWKHFEMQTYFRSNLKQKRLKVAA